ncbi:type I polyketide synthase [Xenorhabdus doucetiae]|uniref:Acyl transferase domain-containing protein n=1 Tax=Xenorhabdus doucetiae TaxID=351671 RepID=A0A068QS74_9GAMM|nr:type I polyketide synthase [Xenorhabdus doucetiae]TYP06531.1 acyl transferase domain-containing protein [Xenorhabdus doucetiae]CDG17501.1 Polyketide synthase involved in xenocoumacin synthesis [Xenorhabdus doucetiae]
MNKKENLTDYKSSQKLTGLEIAIIGISCQFPNSPTVESFWKNCLEGNDCITRFSDETLAENGVPENEYKSQNYVNAKGVIENPLRFDAEFFQYNKREAELLEPQIRHLHQCSFDALGSAGIAPSVYKGKVGCYLVAGAQLQWQMAAYEESKQDAVGLFSAFSLIEKDFAATRLAYKLGLTGPAVALQTACSSSLTAVHMAARALLLGECQVALVAAAALTTPNQQGYLYLDGMIESPDGMCRPFDEHANGTVGGEGVGAIVLQPLKQALEEKRSIIALIKGSAINNDGARKVGYTAPSIEGQTDVIRSAITVSKVGPKSISYIEAHGTATKLGDPIEITALKNAFDGCPAGSIAIGSAKSILGHLDSAAGMAGLIKTALMLKNKMLCANKYFNTPNPKLKLESSPFYINTHSQEWHSQSIRRAGVSSFGIGGTNAHVILEEISYQPLQSEIPEQLTLLPLSAKNEASLSMMENELLKFLSEKQYKLSDIAYTLQQGREHFDYRSVLVCSGDQENHNLSDFVRAKVKYSDKKMVFLYPGQGTQYPGMTYALYQQESVFRESCQACLSLLPEDSQQKLYHFFVNAAEQENVSNEITQLAIFIVEYAMTSLFQSKGFKPFALFGHSLGEYVAATISGVFSLGDALHLVSQRAKLIETMSPGVMLSVSLSAEQIGSYLNEELEIAAINGKESVVISGNAMNIDKLESALQNDNIYCRRLKTSHAFHSRAIDEIQAEYANSLNSVNFDQPNIPIISNLTGVWHSVESIRAPEYWLSHQRNTVDFLRGLETLSEFNDLVFIEMGPGNTLSSFVHKYYQNESENKPLIINMIKHPNLTDDDHEYFYRQLGKIWCSTEGIKWENINQPEGRLIHMPVYQFAKTEYAKLRDKLVSGLNINSDSKQENKNKLYSPGWQRELYYQVGEETKYQQVFILCTQTNNSYYLDLSKELWPGSKVIFIDNLEEVKSLILLTDSTLILIPENEPSENDPIEYYLRWVEGLRVILNLLELQVAQFVLFTPEIENVLGYEQPNPTISLLKGLVQSISHEYQQHQTMQIDFSGNDISDNRLNSLIRGLVSSGKCGFSQYNHAAIRYGQLWVPEFKVLSVNSLNQVKKDHELQIGDLVFISGGLGGIGLALAESLAIQYRARLVLSSRSKFPARSEWDSIKQDPTQMETMRKIESIEKIEQFGGEVHIHSVDVSCKKDLHSLLQSIESELGPFSVVIHAAGSDAGALIAQPNLVLHREIMAAKVCGVNNLLSYFSDKNLHAMLLCSSLLAYYGAYGQSAYVAANAYLEAIADNHNHPFRICSISWDRWLEVGMAAKNRLDTNKTVGLTNREGQDVFLQILSHYPNRFSVSVLPIKERMEENDVLQLDNKDHISNTEISYTEDLIKKVIIEIWKHQLGLINLDENISFFDLGATSLDIVQANERLKEKLNVDIPIAMMFTYSSVIKLWSALQNMMDESSGNIHQNKEDSNQNNRRNLAKNRINKRLRNS